MRNKTPDHQKRHCKLNNGRHDFFRMTMPVGSPAMFTGIGQYEIPFTYPETP